MTVIQSRDNPLFKRLRRLAESGRDRKKLGQTLLDGLHLVQAYEAQCGQVDSLIVSAAATRSAEISAYVADRPVIVIADNLMHDVGVVDTPSGVLAIIPLTAPATVDTAADAILLDGIQDPGNVGTLLRSAAAAGCRQALLSPGCAAAWSPKVLRAGQGAHFALSIIEEADLEDFVQRFDGTSIVTSLVRSTGLFEANWVDPVAWIFGSEGAGVRAELVNAASLRVRIPMPGTMESLNVGAAAAICLFEMVRRRQ
jgi:RNA methyltransferase, TrmH family